MNYLTKSLNENFQVGYFFGINKYVVVKLTVINLYYMRSRMTCVRALLCSKLQKNALEIGLSLVKTHSSFRVSTFTIMLTFSYNTFFLLLILYHDEI